MAAGAAARAAEGIQIGHTAVAAAVVWVGLYFDMVEQVSFPQSLRKFVVALVGSQLVLLQWFAAVAGRRNRMEEQTARH